MDETQPSESERKQWASCRFRHCNVTEYLLATSRGSLLVGKKL